MDARNSFGADRLIQAIERAEVLNVFFPRLGHALILDARSNGSEEPAILIDGMVGSVAARIESFERLRPGLPSPEQLAIAPWFGSVRSFIEAGVYRAIVERWTTICPRAGTSAVDVAMRRLARLERDALRGIVSGQTSRSLWQREPGPRP